MMDSSELAINSFNGFLGIYELPLWFSYALGAFIIISIVNAFNLIDGINGSASMLGIMIFAAFFLYLLSDKGLLFCITFSKLYWLFVGFPPLQYI